MSYPLIHLYFLRYQIFALFSTGFFGRSSLRMTRIMDSAHKNKSPDRLSGLFKG